MWEIHVKVSLIDIPRYLIVSNHLRGISFKFKLKFALTDFLKFYVRFCLQRLNLSDIIRRVSSANSVVSKLEVIDKLLIQSKNKREPKQES